MEATAIETEGANETRADFTADPAELSRAVGYLAKRVASRRNTVPILDCVHVAADLAGAVTLTATNLEQWARVTVPATVSQPGEFCTDALNLAGVLDKARKDKDCREVRVTDGDRVTVKAHRGRFSVPSHPILDFPLPPTADEPLSAFTMPAGKLVQDLASLAPCMSTEETRFYLRGIALQVRELAGRDRLVMAATDGKAIGAASRPIPAGAEAIEDAIIPDTAVQAILHAVKLGPIGETARVELGKSHATITLETATITTKLVGGTFPDWQRIFVGEVAQIQPALFPELLPGVPLPAMEKLAKAAPGAIEWSAAPFGLIGGTQSDDGLMFGACRGRAGDFAKRGFSYSSTGNSGEIIGPDGVTYPVAFSDTAIHLSAAQLRALIGESCFETIELAPGHFVCRWLWEQGDSRLLLVGKDGRIRGEGRQYVTRAEAEAMLAADSAPVSVAEPVAGVTQGATPAPMPSEPEIVPAQPIEPECEPLACAPDPIADVLARVAALEARIDTLSAVSAVTPTVVKRERSPAHERAIRRAWAERKARRMAEAQCAEAAGWAAELSRGYIVDKTKRRRAVQTARKLIRYARSDAAHWQEMEERARADATAWQRSSEQHFAELEAMGGKRDRAIPRARRMIAAARQTATFQRQRADVLHAQLTKLQADMADPMQPERASDIAKLVRERDVAQTAAAASQARAERAERAVGEVADKLEEMAGRVARAEAALRARAA